VQGTSLFMESGSITWVVQITVSTEMVIGEPMQRGEDELLPRRACFDPMNNEFYPKGKALDGTAKYYRTRVGAFIEGLRIKTLPNKCITRT